MQLWRTRARLWKMPLMTKVLIVIMRRYILKEQGLSPVDLLYPSALLFRVPPFHLRLFQHRRLQGLCWGHLRSCWDKIFLPFQHFSGLNRRSDDEVRRNPFYGLQTIRQSKNLWKRQMQPQRVKSDNEENAVYKEEKPQRHHSTKQTDRKRCKFGSQNTLKSSS